ncbi:T-cell surface glycoprotein CD4-like isoform X2 [Archocentrus centrarchus]|uniref:T-cell surface glycoprotein CD4-like isoform X2 n=1 Tax=Archocentrus centrarchus TaxID=63155 RepID=UPI0011EA35D2|nr:T-cell surface glycoprotein CD4-like isoform X2 [Archocentrus centrarchus]
MREADLTSLTWTLLFFCFLGFTSGEEEVKAKPGETVTLPCKAPNNNIITVVEWSRPGRETQCAFLYREGRIDADSQNPIFKDRVDQQDKPMKDGDVSVILKNVMINDTGTYECRVVQTTTNRTERDVEPICIIYLSVSPPVTWTVTCLRSEQKPTQDLPLL